MRLEDFDREEILHTRQTAIEHRRLSAGTRRFPKGSILREDRLPVPAEALREIIINAVIHRDVSNPSSYVAIAVFKDRIDVHSIGEFPTGIRAEMLSREHRSIPRKPLSAGSFHRTGAVEVWGRGTNRVIEACRAYGIGDPTFAEVQVRSGAGRGWARALRRNETRQRSDREG